MTKKNKKGNLKKPQSRRVRFFLIAVCGVAIFALIGFLVWYSHSDDRIIDSQDWPSTTGVVVLTDIKIGKREFDAGWGGGSQTETRYVPALQYVYHVGSQEYTAENITVDSSWSLESFDTQSKANAYLEQNYPIGTEVVVYYNPNDPQDAFLFKREPTSTIEISIIMYFLIVFLMGIIVYILFTLNKPLR